VDQNHRIQDLYAVSLIHHRFVAGQFILRYRDRRPSDPGRREVTGVIKMVMAHPARRVSATLHVAGQFACGLVVQGGGGADADLPASPPLSRSVMALAVERRPRPGLCDSATFQMSMTCGRYLKSRHYTQTSSRNYPTQSSCHFASRRRSPENLAQTKNRLPWSP
jgi:hypothetical protein